jgi:hypothetical protein
MRSWLKLYRLPLEDEAVPRPLLEVCLSPDGKVVIVNFAYAIRALHLDPAGARQLAALLLEAAAKVEPVVPD